MTLPETKACTACALHRLFRGVHLCTLPPECFDLRDENGDPHESIGDWVGMNCDIARKQGEICGPAGNLWTPTRNTGSEGSQP